MEGTRTTEISCTAQESLAATLGAAEALCAPLPASQAAQEHSGEGTGPSQAPSLSPDAHTKGLIAAINSLQQQQEATEEARHSAAEAAAAAAAEAAELKAALHAALQRAAELDDQEQAVQAALDERLQEQGMLAEQLRLLGRRLASLRGSGPSTQGGSAGASDADQARSPAEMQHQLDLLQKKEAAEELQRRLLTLGLGQGTLAALCSEAEHSSVAGGAVPTMKQQGSSISLRKGSWLGSGGGGGGGGLLGNFSFRRRGS